MEETKYMTLLEIKDKLRIDVVQIRRYIKSGKLKAIKYGRTYLVKEEDFDDFFQNEYIKLPRIKTKVIEG